MSKLSPLQFERLRNLSQCALFRHFHPISLGLLEGYAIDAESQTFRAAVRVEDGDLNSLGLLPLSVYSRLMEDAVMALGYVLSGELLMPARLEADYMLAVGPGETLDLTAREAKHQGRLAWYELTLQSQGTLVARATVTAMEIRTFPESLQLKIIKAAEQGLLQHEVLFEFIHLFHPRHYLAAKEAAERYPSAEAKPVLE